MPTGPDVPLRVSQLAAEMIMLKPMRRGSLSERTIKCGKPGCACAEDPKARHGPYYSLTRAVEGKTKSRFLNPEQAAMAKQQIETGKEFRNHLDAYWEACEQWADTQLEISPTAPSEQGQKGGSKRTSKAKPSRRSRPS